MPRLTMKRRSTGELLHYLLYYIVLCCIRRRSTGEGAQLLLAHRPVQTVWLQAGCVQAAAVPRLHLCASVGLLKPVHPSMCLLIDCRQADLQRMDILINGEAVDALARIVHREKAQHVGRRLVAKLKVCAISRSVADAGTRRLVAVELYRRSVQGMACRLVARLARPRASGRPGCVCR